jgi:ankyrin repeat protein
LQTDVNEKTALIIASEEHFGIIDLLLSKGALLTQTDKDGLIALSWAVVFGCICLSPGSLELLLLKFLKVVSARL